jgi:hypothetical protein
MSLSCSVENFPGAARNDILLYVTRSFPAGRAAIQKGVVVRINKNQ